MALESPVLGSLFASLLFPDFAVEIKLQVHSSSILLFAVLVLLLGHGVVAIMHIWPLYTQLLHFKETNELQLFFIYCWDI